MSRCSALVSMLSMLMPERRCEHDWSAMQRPRWAGHCREIAVRFRGPYAYVDACDESYEPSVLFSGSPVGAPEEAFDCAAFVYLQG